MIHGIESSDRSEATNYRVFTGPGKFWNFGKVPDFEKRARKPGKPGNWSINPGENPTVFLYITRHV